MAKHCKDCKSFAPFDVFKGNCESFEKRVLLDAPADSCPKFQQMAKCGFCRNYTVKPQDQFLGICKKGPDVFGDLAACGDFEPNA